MAGFPKYQNVTAPDLSNLIALQSQGASNAFNSLADIGNTIQNIQQKNIDRDNRNLLAQGMLQSLNKDPSVINTINKGVANSKLPLEQLQSLINVRDNQIKNEQSIDDQRLALTVENTPPTQQKNLFIDSLNNRDTPIPSTIFDTVLNNTSMIRDAISNNQDTNLIRENTSSPDPNVNANNLNLIPYTALNTKAGINLLTSEQSKASNAVNTQNQTLSDNSVQSSIDTAYNKKSPNYKPVSFRGDTPEDITLNSFDDINNQSNELIKQVQQSNLNPIQQQKAIAQINTNTQIAKKRNLISLTENGYLDPSIYPQIFVDAGFNKAEIESAYKNYNTKNINFSKDIDKTDPIYTSLRGVQEVLTSYETEKEKKNQSFENKIVEVSKRSKAFEGKTGRESYNIFLKQYGDSVDEGSLYEAVEKVQKETRGLLTVPEALALIDYTAQYAGDFSWSDINIGNSSIYTDFKERVNKKSFTPEVKTEILKNAEISSQIDDKVKIRIQELQNLKNQYKDPTNRISKSIVKDNIEKLSKEIQQLVNPNYGAEILTNKIVGN